MDKWYLKEKKLGKPVLMRDGRPFTYTSYPLASIGRRVLSKENDESYVIVPPSA